MGCQKACVLPENPASYRVGFALEILFIQQSHLVVDSNTHEIICADLSLNNVTDSEAFPGLIRQTHRKSGQPRQTGLTIPGSVTMNCAAKISALIPPEKEQFTGPVSTQTATVPLLISG